MASCGIGSDGFCGSCAGSAEWKTGRSRILSIAVSLSSGSTLRSTTSYTRETLDMHRIRPTIRPIGREGKALQRCTLSARSMPGDGQQHWLQPVLLPSHPSFGRKATNLLNWGEAPSPITGWNHYPPVGHMSTSMGVLDSSQIYSAQRS